MTGLCNIVVRKWTLEPSEQRLHLSTQAVRHTTPGIVIHNGYSYAPWSCAVHDLRIHVWWGGGMGGGGCHKQLTNIFFKIPFPYL